MRVSGKCAVNALLRFNKVTCFATAFPCGLVVGMVFALNLA